MGFTPIGQALLRGGAKPGDAVLVSGTLGDARGALEYLALPESQLNAQQRYFLQRYYKPNPRLALGMALRGVATATIDISDGLAADLGHILERSKVGASIDLTKLPLSTALHSHPNALEFALSGGDDYELCFTVPPARLDRVFAVARQLDIPIAAIGIITQAQEFTGYGRDGEIVELQKSGYQHF
jgi:thiamine-monophosphate kinase